MTTAILMMADHRREYTEQSLRSLVANLPLGHFDLFVHDDSCEPTFALWLGNLLDEVWGSPWTVMCASEKRGFGGAIRHSWEYIYDIGEYDYVFHTENDFTFNEPIPISSMGAILEADRNLAQVALLRQAWSPREKRAGGVLPAWPEGTFRLHRSGRVTHLEHDAFWTTNPSLIPIHVIGMGWPDVPESEGMFTFKLREMGLHFGYFGRPDDPPRVTHIGYDRVAQDSGY